MPSDASRQTRSTANEAKDGLAGSLRQLSLRQCLCLLQLGSRAGEALQRSHDAAAGHRRRHRSSRALCQLQYSRGVQEGAADERSLALRGLLLSDSLEARPEALPDARIARRCEMWRRKDAVVVQLLQGLTAPQIAPHSRFAAAEGFPAGPLGSPLHLGLEGLADMNRTHAMRPENGTSHPTGAFRPGESDHRHPMKSSGQGG